MRVQAPDALARYIAAKGSICVDGVSLTVNRVDGAGFEIEHRPAHTGGNHARQLSGRRVNLEVDLIARYLERLLLGDRAARPGGDLTEALLREHGFWK